MQAALAVEHWWLGDHNALAVYACAIQQRFDEYLHLRTMYYGREERWQSSPFWQRRQAVQDASD